MNKIVQDACENFQDTYFSRHLSRRFSKTLGVLGNRLENNSSILKGILETVLKKKVSFQDGSPRYPFKTSMHLEKLQGVLMIFLMS